MAKVHAKRSVLPALRRRSQFSLCNPYIVASLYNAATNLYTAHIIANFGAQGIAATAL